MTKNVLNQNGKYVQELIDIIEPDFIFNDEPINRFTVTNSKHDNLIHDKSK